MKIYPAFVSIALLSYACASFSHAQPTPVQQATPSPANAEEEIVQMDTFNVVSGEDTGYIATDTITGTRVATLLRDLPYTVNVVMGEFMMDFDLNGVNDGFAYTSAFSNSNGASGAMYTIRGIPQTMLLRNGFKRIGMIDRVNVDRIEIIKGPSAAMYGQTQPGGILNVITKKPKPKSSAYVRLTGGGYKTQRLEMNATGALYRGTLGETTALVSAASYQRDYETEYRSNDQKMGALVIHHKFPSGTLLSLEYEQMKKIIRGTTGVPYLYIDGTYLGFAKELFNFSTSGPDSYTNREVHTLTAVLEHRLTEELSMRATLFYDDRDYRKLSASGSRFDPISRVIISRQPSYNTIDLITKGAQVDFLAHWRADAIAHRILFTLDFNYYRDDRSTYRVSSAIYNNPAYFARNLSVDNPNYILPSFDPALYTKVTRDNYYETSVYGAFFRYQINALNERLTGVAGIRYDLVTFDLLQVATEKMLLSYASATSPLIGINYKLTPRYTLFANFSKSFVPQGDIGSNGEKLDNEIGTGYEGGVRSLFFGGRLKTTISVYSIVKTGVKSTEVEEVSTTIGPDGVEIIEYVTSTRTLGTVKSEGVELDFQYRVGKQIQILGGWGWINPRVTYSGNDLDAVGRMPGGVPKVNGGISGKYTISSGPLRNLSFTLGVNYMGYTYAVNPNVGGLAGSDKYIRSNDGRREIRVPGRTICNMGASYLWRMSNVRRHRVGINIKNVFDKKYITTSGSAGDRFGIYVNYGLFF